MAEPLADNRAGQKLHLIQRVHVADVVPARALPQIAVKMLVEKAMEGAVVAALEQAPEPLHAVDHRIAPHILSDGVIDGRMGAGNARVGFGLVRIDRCRAFRPAEHEALQGLRVGALDNRCASLLRVAVCHPGDE